MKNDPRSTPKSSPDSKPNKIVSLHDAFIARAEAAQEAYEAAKRERAQKYGRASRTKIPRMPYEGYVAEFRWAEVIQKLWANRAGFNREEFDVLQYLAVYQTGRKPVSTSDIGRLFGWLPKPPSLNNNQPLPGVPKQPAHPQWTRLAALIRRLSACGLIVNIGNTGTQLGVHPWASNWDLRRLKEMRNADLQKSGRGHRK